MMDIEYFRQYALNKKAVTEETPFGDDVLVYKVYGKIFLLISLETPFKISLKSDPELSVELREKYENIIPAYHMNKKHWNTIIMDGSVPLQEILKLIDCSYNLVLKGISDKKRK